MNKNRRVKSDVMKMKEGILGLIECLVFHDHHQ